MVEIGNSLELRVYRNAGPYFDMQTVMPLAALKIYADGSVVCWAQEPTFELGKTRIGMREGENAWDTVVRAIQQARKAW